MSILVDTNIFLDVLLEREGLADASQSVIDWCAANAGEAWIAWHSLANLYYIGSKTKNHQDAMRELDAILEVFEICPTNTESARFARNLPMKDFEDALQVAAAVAAGVDSIVTRNTRDFKKAPLQVQSPEAFLKSL